jgi:hypothetical protein
MAMKLDTKVFAVDLILSVRTFFSSIADSSGNCARQRYWRKGPSPAKFHRLPFLPIPEMRRNCGEHQGTKSVSPLAT